MEGRRGVAAASSEAGGAGTGGHAAAPGWGGPRTAWQSWMLAYKFTHPRLLVRPVRPTPQLLLSYTPNPALPRRPVVMRRLLGFMAALLRFAFLSFGPQLYMSGWLAVWAWVLGARRSSKCCFSAWSSFPSHFSVPFFSRFLSLSSPFPVSSSVHAVLTTG